MRHIKPIFREARSNLTRLGLGLFYFYMLLALLGLIGMLFGITSLIEKFFFGEGIGASAWWEIIALILISWYMIKIFLREGANLAEADSAKPVLEYSENEDKPSHSNVIPFNRKSTW